MDMEVPNKVKLNSFWYHKLMEKLLLNFPVIFDTLKEFLVNFISPVFDKLNTVQIWLIYNCYFTLHILHEHWHLGTPAMYWSFILHLDVPSPGRRNHEMIMMRMEEWINIKWVYSQPPLLRVVVPATGTYETVLE